MVQGVLAPLEEDLMARYTIHTYLLVHTGQKNFSCLLQGMREEMKKAAESVKMSEWEVSLASVNYSKKEHSMMWYWHGGASHM